MAGAGAQSAAVALLFIDLDDFPDHLWAPPLALLILCLDYSIIYQTVRLYLQRKGTFMKEFIPVLKRTKLFAGVGEDDITAMLSCLGARLRTFKKGDYVLRQGEHLGDILVLAEGKLHIQRDDYWGNRKSVISGLRNAVQQNQSKQRRCYICSVCNNWNRMFCRYRR